MLTKLSKHWQDFNILIFSVKTLLIFLAFNQSTFTKYRMLFALLSKVIKKKKSQNCLILSIHPFYICPFLEVLFKESITEIHWNKNNLPNNQNNEETKDLKLIILVPLVITICQLIQQCFTGVHYEPKNIISQWKSILKARVPYCFFSIALRSWYIHLVELYLFQSLDSNMRTWVKQFILYIYLNNNSSTLESTCYFPLQRAPALFTTNAVVQVLQMILCALT